MAELTIEQKAEAYDFSLKRAKKLQETCDSQAVVGWCEYIFPELKESEDEKIRKWLIAQLELKSDVNNSRELELMILKSIAWLEKQGNKPQGKTNTAWSDKDEETLFKMMFAFKARVFPSLEECDNFIDFLKLLKNKVQPKQERGDEDECYMSGFLNLTDD